MSQFIIITVILSTLVLQSLVFCKEINCNILAKCTTKFEPICATDGEYTLRTFTNNCFYENEYCLYGAQFTKVFDGICPGQPTDRCDAYHCNKVVPVCATFSGKQQSFSSQCEVEKRNCIQPKEDYKTIHDGSCIDQ